MAAITLKELISEQQIQDRISVLGKEISSVYKDEPLVVVCVLKGAFMFFSDLVKRLSNKPQLDFVRLSSYGEGTCSSKTIHFSKDVETQLSGKHVLIVEDIIDTGHSMDFLMRQFAARGALSLRIAVLLDKKERREVPISADFVGFTLPSGFVVGYGLDYAEYYRELPAIYEAEFHD